MDSAHDNSIKVVFDKKKVSILITDSGLGGLSICAEVVSRLHREPLFKDAAITYYNAWPEQSRGYNKFGTVDERIRIFDRALLGMKPYGPDLIMIACNTLSALYDRTEFSRHSGIPVLGIIDFGVSLILEKLITTPQSKVLVLGTLTTIAENRHKELLVKKGIDPDRIITQACDGLAGAIEKNPESDVVVELTDRYIREAASKFSQTRCRIYVALCCTHFDYIAPAIEKKVKQHVTEDVRILNPNPGMSQFLFKRRTGGVFFEPTINIRVVSKVKIDDVKIDAISRLIKEISPETTEALMNYEYQPDLFVF